MRDIIQICIDLDTAAIGTYKNLSAACQDEAMSTLFAQMGREEESHVDWWTDLLEAWDAGLVSPVTDEDELLDSLQRLAADVEVAIPEEYSDLSVDQMLSLAAHLEFYMLDPVFSELIDMVRPTKMANVRDAYTRHVMRLVGAIEARDGRSELAHFLARALMRALRDQQRLSKLATQDPLTALYNRRGFYAFLQQWVSFATRYQHPVSVVLVDIDRFKAINDTYGHPAGDVALQAIATTLRGAVRSSDIVGRYGGDEFAILAPETDETELAALMERILVAIRATPLGIAQTAEHITVSIGGSFVTGGALVTPEQMLAAADQALYRAKAAGRDRAALPSSAIEV